MHFFPFHCNKTLGGLYNIYSYTDDMHTYISASYMDVRMYIPLISPSAMAWVQPQFNTPNSKKSP